MTKKAAQSVGGPFEPRQARFRIGQRDLHLACLDPKSAPTTRTTVLVVDDEIEMRGVLREILALRDYAVLDTGNPEEALSGPLVGRTDRLKIRPHEEPCQTKS